MPPPPARDRPLTTRTWQGRGWSLRSLPVPARVARVLGVGLMLSLWLLLIGLASSDGLHRLVHADAHSPSHECLIKSFAQGSFLQPVAQAAALAAPSFFEQPPPAAPTLRSLIDLRLAPSRAPPFASA